MPWGYAIAAGASLIGNQMSSNANKKAANASAQAAQQGVDTIKGYYNDAKGYMQPYMDTGIMGNSQLQKLLGGDYSGFYNSPDYKAAMQSGGDMLDRSAASHGMLFSGAHQKDLSNFGQQMATQYLGNYRNWLGGIQANGQAAAGDLGRLGMGAGNSIATLYGGAGNARASSYAANGANTSDTFGQLGNLAMSYFGSK